MVKIVFVMPEGEERTIDAAAGLSIMEAAVRNNVAGIDADCGGACTCATCMVYVPGDWRDRLPPKQKTEQDMLEFCEHATESSRLSCQIKVTEILDGLRLEIPKSQH